jgi:hypothetical protein
MAIIGRRRSRFREWDCDAGLWLAVADPSRRVSVGDGQGGRFDAFAFRTGNFHTDQQNDKMRK